MRTTLSLGVRNRSLPTPGANPGSQPRPFRTLQAYPGPWRSEWVSGRAVDAWNGAVLASSRGRGQRGQKREVSLRRHDRA